MKTGNNSLKDLEKKRGMFFRTGLVCSLMITFFAFEWRTTVTREEVFPESAFSEAEEIMIPVTLPRRNQEAPTPVMEKHHVNEHNPANDFRIIADNQVISVAADSISAREIFPITVPVETDSSEAEPSLMPDVFPEFPGGEAALVNYLSEQIKYPERARKDGLTGAAYIHFVIDEKGDAVQISVQHTTNPVFSKEAMRVIDAMPLWKPGIQGGKKVKVIMTLPVTFRLL